MSEPIENLYFNWLCAKVLERNNQNYRALLKILHKTEFVWVIDMDRNRAEDGIELRVDFYRESYAEEDPFFMNQPCSIFEMLFAFAKRAEFQTNVSFKDWFWIFMTHLKLDDFMRVSNLDVMRIEDILYTFMYRQYDPSGDGGLFPMQHTQRDQRKIQLWYQFFEYIDEQQIL